MTGLKTGKTDSVKQVYNWDPHKDVCYKLYIEDRKVRHPHRLQPLHVPY